ncbi:MAG: hypothetical protein M3198_02345 [Actinomycetota bacterium]|nr:hypothetical protein [Actinomycetota bacterium]
MTTVGACERLRILVLGYIIRGPLGGLTWHHLQYVVGLADLGHDVYFLEDSDDYPSCYDPERFVTDVDPSYGLRFTSRAFSNFGLGERWAYHDAHQARWFGPCASRIADICGNADLVLNLSGVNPLRPWVRRVPVRILVDTDPVFTQIRHLTDASARSRAREHTSFLTFGENISGRSSIPDDQLPWRPTRQPVVLDAWPVTAGPEDGRFTTVMQWESYPALEYQGRHFGMKSDSFSQVIGLPERLGPLFELALGSPTAPRSALRQKGWLVRDPTDLSRDPWAYQRYLQRSKAEFGVAKHGYVVTRSGWFSERSAAYLASGRPVLVQETGFSDWLETGCGAVAYGTADEAIEGALEICGRYELHCKTAREVAEAYFDSRQVLARLLEESLHPLRSP